MLAPSLHVSHVLQSGAYAGGCLSLPFIIPAFIFRAASGSLSSGTAKSTIEPRMHTLMMTIGMSDATKPVK